MKFGIDTFGGCIDLNLLVVFDAIYGSRNLTAAGKQLGLSQPAMRSRGCASPSRTRCSCA